MADFTTVLRKTIDGLEVNTAETREHLYQRARDTIEAKLAAASSSEEVAARQKELLENAISTVESDYREQEGSELPGDDLDDLLGSLDVAEPQTHPADAEPSTDAGDDHEAPAHEDPAGPEETAFVSSADEPGHDGADEADDDLGEPFFEDEHQPAPENPAAGVLRAAEPERPEEGFEEGFEERPAAAPSPSRGSSRSGLFLTLLLGLMLVGAAAYGGWHYRDDLTRLAGLDESGDAAAQQEAEAPANEPETEDVAAQESGDTTDNQQNSDAASSQDTGKFTQRLTLDGDEVDAGPASGEPSLGEGTSVAAATQTGDEAQSRNSAGQESGEALTVGQRAIFYEERTNATDGSAQSGNVVWSIVEESPGDNLPPEPAIRAEATIPDKGLQLKMTIRRNVDQSLPASHIVELIFLTPEDFEGGSIDSVLRVAMKRSEQDTGSPLLGIPAKIADGFFLVALSDSQADLETNTTLLRRQNWIDVPIVYTSGRRALITLEKGTAGTQVFNEALQAWASASSG